MAARQKSRHGKGSSRKKKRVPPYGDKPRTSSKLTGSAKKPFKFLDHPADVGFVAHGKALPETFAAAAQALCDFGWELKNVRPRQQMEIRARAATLEDLLYSWLSEILFLTDAEQWVFRRFQVHEVREQSEKEKEGTERLAAEAQSARRKSGDESAAADSSPLPNSASSPVAHATGEGLTAWEIRATAQGEKFVPARHRSRTYIKAVTYHQLSIKKAQNGYEATVFLDV
jgi:SHS2 domain-containing protein